MTPEKITRQSLFAKLRRYVCNGETLPNLTKISKDECREIKIRYVDMLLADKHRNALYNASGYLYKNNNVSDFEDELNERQKVLLQFCREVVDAAMKLDAKDLRAIDMLGICGKGKTSTYNRKLSKFLTETPYKHVACSILEIMTTNSLVEAAQMGYQPAQDYLAELPYTNNLDKYDDKEMKKRFKALRQYEWHLKSGQKQGFTIEEIITHDEIYGFFMNRFEPTVMPAARRIAKFIAEEMPKHVKGYDVEVSLFSQSEEVKREVGKGLKRVAEFIRNVRDNEFAEGWLMDDSLEFSYLMAHAERIAVESVEKRR